MTQLFIVPVCVLQGYHVPVIGPPPPHSLPHSIPRPGDTLQEFIFPLHPSMYKHLANINGANVDYFFLSFLAQPRPNVPRSAGPRPSWEP